MTGQPTPSVVLLNAPPSGYRLFEKRVRIGAGQARWDFAKRETLSWGIKVRSGFIVESSVIGSGGNSREPIAVGDSVRLILRLGLFRVREPVKVLQVIDEPNRQGFVYGTLPGHQLLGEEQFLVEKDDAGIVWLTVRTVSRPAPGWGWARPLLTIGQWLVRGRYLKALSRPIE